MREGVAITRVASATGTPRDPDSEMQSLCQLSPNPGLPAPLVWPPERSLQKLLPREAWTQGAWRRDPLSGDLRSQ